MRDRHICRFIIKYAQFSRQGRYHTNVCTDCELYVFGPEAYLILVRFHIRVDGERPGRFVWPATVARRQSGFFNVFGMRARTISRVLNSSAYVIVGPVLRYICKSAENRSQFMARQGCHYLKNKVITKVSVGIFASPFPQRNDFSVLQVLYTEPFSVMFGETYELLMAEGLVTFQSFK